MRWRYFAQGPGRNSGQEGGTGGAEAAADSARYLAPAHARPTHQRDGGATFGGTQQQPAVLQSRAVLAAGASQAATRQGRGGSGAIALETHLASIHLPAAALDARLQHARLLVPRRSHGRLAQVSLSGEQGQQQREALEPFCCLAPAPARLTCLVLPLAPCPYAVSCFSRHLSPSGISHLFLSKYLASTCRSPGFKLPP